MSTNVINNKINYLQYTKQYTSTKSVNQFIISTNIKHKLVVINVKKQKL